MREAFKRVLHPTQNRIRRRRLILKKLLTHLFLLVRNVSVVILQAPKHFFYSAKTPNYFMCYFFGIAPCSLTLSNKGRLKAPYFNLVPY